MRNTTATPTLTDVSLRDCPSCTRLVCRDWRTCPGYLRELLGRLEHGDRGERQGVRT